MYQLLLCTRYLRTRYIALASIISVTLGVATMIVVNSVMAGFRAEMHRRLHGILADVVVESISLSGTTDPEGHMEEIRKVVGDDKIAGMTAVATVPAMISVKVRDQWVTRQVNVIGVDETTYAQVSDFSRYLLHEGNRERLSFLLRTAGYDTFDRENPTQVRERVQLQEAGWPQRQARVGFERAYQRQLESLRTQGQDRPQRYFPPPPESAPTNDDPSESPDDPIGPVAPASFTEEMIVTDDAAETPAKEPSSDYDAPAPQNQEHVADSIDGEAVGGDLAAPPVFAPEIYDESLRPADDAGPATPPAAEGFVGPRGHHPFTGRQSEPAFDEATQQFDGVILGIGLVSVRRKTPAGQAEDYFLAVPGDDVKITFPTAGTPPKAVTDTFTIVDLYESKMSEYDSGFAFVPLRKLQELRGMIDPLTGNGAFTSIQIKLHEGVNLVEVRDQLRERFPPHQFPYRVQTWMDMQGPLLQAVQMETTILNILLFMIIAVAGFGILATFFMIVVEKTRDIGILKSLGAPSGGVLNIFLAYGLSLGIVGAGAGVALGVLFVWNINHIATVIEWITGREVFDPTIYYFREIPTILDPFTVGWIMAGALLIAVLASVLPAIRASQLHPVEALRYE